MLNWIGDTLLAMISWIPTWLYVEDSPRYYIVRCMLAIGLFVLIMLFFAVRPDRSALERFRRYRETRHRSSGL